MNGVVLAVKDLRKRYGAIEVVRGLSFDIHRGECFGLLGPNGAGKTTTLRCCLGLVDPDGGEITMVGEPVPKAARQARIRVGVVPQQDNLDPDFTVTENLRMYGNYFGIDRATLDERIPRLLEFAGLTARAGVSLRTLSGGMKRRLMVAKAMVHNPPVLILDEPTAGVDVELRRQLWAYVVGLNRLGVTIVLTTHYLQEAEELCDSIAIINRGEVVACEPTSQLLRRIDTRTVVITPREPLSLVPDLGPFEARIRAGGDLAITFKSGEAGVEQVLTAVRDAGVTIKELATENPDLEDVFMALTYGAPTPAALAPA